jgi:hypothetical protein
MYNNDNNNLMGREYHAQSSAKSMIIAVLILMTLILSPSIAYSRPFSIRSSLDETSTEHNSPEGLDTPAKTPRTEGTEYVATTNQQHIDWTDPFASGVAIGDMNSKGRLEENVEKGLMSQLGRISQEICASNRDNLNEQVG